MNRWSWPGRWSPWPSLSRQGRVTFTVSRPGPWPFKATHLMEGGGDGKEWKAEFTTLTVEAGK